MFLPYDVSWRSDYGSTAWQGLQRGTSHQAAHLARVVVANHDDVPVTAHDIAAHTPDAH